MSTATVYSLIHRGEIPHVRLSNAVRVHPQDLEAFIARPSLQRGEQVPRRPCRHCSERETAT